MTTPKTEAMQYLVTRMKGYVAEFGDARERKDDETADAMFTAVLQGIEAQINQTVADIPPKVIEKEVVVPAPFQGSSSMNQPAPAPETGLKKFVPSFLRK